MLKRANFFAAHFVWWILIELDFKLHANEPKSGTKIFLSIFFRERTFDEPNNFQFWTAISKSSTQTTITNFSPCENLVCTQFLPCERTKPWQIQKLWSESFYKRPLFLSPYKDLFSFITISCQNSSFVQKPWGWSMYILQSIFA